MARRARRASKLARAGGRWPNAWEGHMHLSRIIQERFDEAPDFSSPWPDDTILLHDRYRLRTLCQPLAWLGMHVTLEMAANRPGPATVPQAHNYVLDKEISSGIPLPWHGFLALHPSVAILVQLRQNA